MPTFRIVMYRSTLHGGQTHGEASNSDTGAIVALVFVLVVCVLRIVQGLLLEPRLGAETSLAMLGGAWALRALIVDLRSRYA